MNDDDRSTPLGLFNYARSYWQSGVLLHHARAKVTQCQPWAAGERLRAVYRLSKWRLPLEPTRNRESA